MLRRIDVVWLGVKKFSFFIFCFHFFAKTLTTRTNRQWFSAGMLSPRRCHVIVLKSHNYNKLINLSNLGGPFSDFCMICNDHIRTKQSANQRIAPNEIFHPKIKVVVIIWGYDWYFALFHTRLSQYFLYNVSIFLVESLIRLT